MLKAGQTFYIVFQSVDYYFQPAEFVMRKFRLVEKNPYKPGEIIIHVFPRECLSALTAVGITPILSRRKALRKLKECLRYS